MFPEVELGPVETEETQDVLGQDTVRRLGIYWLARPGLAPPEPGARGEKTGTTAAGALTSAKRVKGVTVAILAAATIKA